MSTVPVEAQPRRLLGTPLPAGAGSDHALGVRGQGGQLQGQAQRGTEHARLDGQALGLPQRLAVARLEQVGQAELGQHP
ncbi:hypothetical protein, partial [Pseudonocardia pini]|uniref:hypothetical protein n=1 Tax=Pseudonocardia pini TaxID=2758030 RepID=UPI001C68AFA3